MMEVIGVIRRGLTITVAPANWPLRGPFEGVRVSVSGQTWNGSLTLNKTFTVAELEEAEKPEELVNQAIRDLSESKDW